MKIFRAKAWDETKEASSMNRKIAGGKFQRANAQNVAYDCSQMLRQQQQARFFNFPFAG